MAHPEHAVRAGFLKRGRKPVDRDVFRPKMDKLLKLGQRKNRLFRYLRQQVPSLQPPREGRGPQGRNGSV